MKMVGKKSILYMLFFCTGICGLIYQVLWVRMFGLIFGNTVYASSTVLAAFMGGLALGSFLAGRFITQRDDGLKIYAGLELLVGIFGVLMPLAMQLLSGSYTWLYQEFKPSFGVLTVFRFTLSFIILLIPCTFMGATLPVISKYITDHQMASDEVIGKLYGVNTIGAVFGCFSAGFVLVGKIGITKASLLAAVINLSIASTAIYLYKRYKEEEMSKAYGLKKETKKTRKLSQQPISESSKVTPRFGKVLLITYGFSGFAALALEIAWTKALVWIIGMDSYAFASMLSVILAGIGIGSLLFSLIKKKIINTGKVLYGIQFFIGVFILLSILIIQKSVGITAGILDIANDSTVLHFLFAQLGTNATSTAILSFMTFFVPSLLMGLSFPLFTRLYIHHEGTVGKGIGNIYSVNTLGGIFGSLLMGFYIIPAIGLLPSIALMAGIYFVNSLVILIISNADLIKVRYVKVAALLLCSTILISMSNLKMTDFLKSGLGQEEYIKDEKLIYFKETPTGGVMVKESNLYGKELLIDGVQVASTGDFDLHSHLYPAHLMALLKKDPENALIVAFGCGGTTGSFLKYNEVSTVDVVEICEGVVEPAKKYFTQMNSNVFENPKMNLIIQDGKNYVKMTDKTYDIIYSGPIHPQSNQGSAALYTRDYFEDCREKLSPGGFQCLWLPLHMSSDTDFKTIVKTFLEVYPYVMMWDLPQTAESVNHPHLIGSMEPIYPDYQLIEEKLKKPGILQDIARLNDTSFKTPEEFISQFMMDEKGLRKLVAGIGKLNTDDLPVVEYYSPTPNNKLALNATKIKLLNEISTNMVNPFSVLQNVPEDRKSEIQKELDRLYEGNKNLILGHFYLNAKNAIGMDTDAKILEHYKKAFALIPESTYLKKYLAANK